MRTGVDRVNAHDPSRYSGGSSSGSAAAVAAGLVPVAIAFDGWRLDPRARGVVGRGWACDDLWPRPVRRPRPQVDDDQGRADRRPRCTTPPLALAVIGASPHPHNHYYATLPRRLRRPAVAAPERFGELASLEGLTIGVVAPWHSARPARGRRVGDARSRRSPRVAPPWIVRSRCRTCARCTWRTPSRSAPNSRFRSMARSRRLSRRPARRARRSRQGPPSRPRSARA